MSISEILVVLLVALFVVKPEDIPSIIKQIKKIRGYFKKIQLDIFSIIEDKNLNDDTESINKYLSKISSLNQKYEGDYNLTDIKSFYHKIIKNKK